MKLLYKLSKHLNNKNLSIKYNYKYTKKAYIIYYFDNDNNKLIKGTIYLNIKLSMQDMFIYILHEYGHYYIKVHKYIINKLNKNIIYKIYNKYNREQAYRIFIEILAWNYGDKLFHKLHLNNTLLYTRFRDIRRYSLRTYFKNLKFDN